MEPDEVVARVERHWDDIEYYVVAEANGYVMDFKVYETIRDYGEPTTLQFLRAGGDHGMDIVTTTAEAQVYASGAVKWDGCSNWVFDELNRCALHFCSRGEATNVGVMMGRVYDLAADLISHWDP